MSSNTQEKRWVPGGRVLALAIALGALTLSGCSPGADAQGDENDDGATGDASALNRLSTEEQADGWRSLFDGETLAGWRGYGLEGLPAGWEVAEGTIHFSPPEEGERSDLMTEEQFESFDLAFDWAVTPGGNSGIFFHVSEDYDRSYETGPEYQILDNAGHRDGGSPLTSAGSNYALHPPTEDVTRPLGEFNEARILVHGDHVEHWLNGHKLLAYTLWDDDWKARVAASKFGSMPGYGRNHAGHVVLQDHGDEIWVRNVKIRTLP